MLDRRDFIKYLSLSSLLLSLKPLKPSGEIPVCISKLFDYGIDLGKFQDIYLEAYRNILKTYGQSRPVWIDTNCHVLSGHGIVMAASQLGIETIRCEVMQRTEFDKIVNYWGGRYHVSALYALGKPNVLGPNVLAS